MTADIFLVKDFMRLKDPKQNQIQIIELLRKKYLFDKYKISRYIEKPNKIKFTIKAESNIYFGKVDFIADTYLKIKVTKYPIFQDAMEYSDIVIELRRKGKTQKQIANRLSLSQPTISRIINQQMQQIHKKL